MHPDVRNAEVTYAFDIILDSWVFNRFILLAIFIHIYTLANKDMFNHENMTRYHVYFFLFSILTVSSFHKQ